MQKVLFFVGASGKVLIYLGIDDGYLFGINITILPPINSISGCGRFYVTGILF